MNIISFNIMYKNDRKIILTEAPYLYVNNNLRSIILEIRKLIKEDFEYMSNQLNVPVSTLALGMTTYSTEQNNMHFFEIDVYKIKEIKELLLNI